MGLLEFNKLPINTLVGADWKTFNAITKGREIDAAYKGKFRLTKAVCRMLSILAPLQDKRYEKLLADKPLEHDPVFILGHWRSGTTFVHNVFSCDSETSKYPEEKKETSISKVAASEMERAQTVVRAPRGCGLHKVLESIAEQFWEI